MENNMKKFTAQGKTKLVDGSISMPELAGLRLIIVPASENGKPEGELYNILDKKWKNVKAEFKGWFAHHLDFKLGSTHTTFVQSDICIVYMLCYNFKNELNEKGLEIAIKNLSKMAISDKASVHVSTSTLFSIPIFETLIKEHLLEKGINVYFYKEPIKVEAKYDDTGAIVMKLKDEPTVVLPIIDEIKIEDVKIQKKKTKTISKKIVKKIAKPTKVLNIEKTVIENDNITNSKE